MIRRAFENRLKDYRFISTYDHDDEIWIARVSEFPSLAAHGNDAGEAQRELRSAVQDVLDDLVAEGEEVPVPLSWEEDAGGTGSKLHAGFILAHQVCPFLARCDGKCPVGHRGENHSVDFSCAVARGFDLIERK